jgi:hypothetical protein
MAVSTGFATVSLKEILSKVTELDIAGFYFGITYLPCLINAPYRKDDKPSVSLFAGSDNQVLFKDFGTNEAGDIFTLLKKTWNTSLKSVINRIARDLPLFGVTVKTRRPKVYSITPGYDPTATLKCKVREWRDYDLEYWETYGVSLPWLKFGEVYPVSQVMHIKEGVTRTIPAEKLAYAYVERKDGNITLKIYQPLSKTFKWINKHDSSVWDLWTKIPERGECLIITSSRKDALCIWENTGIPAVSLQGEGYIPKKHVVDQLKERFKHVFILYDNDFTAEVNHGRLFGQQLAERFGLIQLEIPEKYLSKDTSDLAKNHGRETVNKVILSLVKKAIQTNQTTL